MILYECHSPILIFVCDEDKKMKQKLTAKEEVLCCCQLSVTADEVLHWRDMKSKVL